MGTLLDALLGREAAPALPAHRGIGSMGWLDANPIGTESVQRPEVAEWLRRFGNNPPGKESTRQQWIANAPAGPIDPVVGFSPFGGEPIRQSEREEAVRDAAERWGNIANAALMMAPGGGAVAGAAREAALAGTEARALSRRAGYTPRNKPARAQVEDYPSGVPHDATGRITHDIDGRPLTATFVAGRSQMGSEGTFPDWGLSPAAIERIGKETGVARLLDVPAKAVPGGGVGAHIKDYDPATGLPAARVYYRQRMKPYETDNVIAHEIAGHHLDWRGGNRLSVKGQIPELEQVYFDLNSGVRGRLGKVECMSPRNYPHNYPEEEVAGELTAEALRAYAQNPNYFKTVAPEMATRIRAYVNTNPELSRWIQFNSIGGMGLAATGNRQDGDQ